MPTTCLNYLVEATKGSRFISGYSNTKSFKRVWISYGSKSANFFAAPAKNTDYEPLLLPDGKSSIVLSQSPPKLPITIIALVSDEGSVNGYPLGQFKLMNIDEPKFGHNKIHHSWDIDCKNPKSNIIECSLRLTVEYWL